METSPASMKVTPMLQPLATRLRFRSNGSSKAEQIVRQTFSILPSDGLPAIVTTNSSPPRR